MPEPQNIFPAVSSNIILYLAVLISGCGGLYSPIRWLNLTRVVEGELKNCTVIAEMSFLLNNSRPLPNIANITVTGDPNFGVNSKGEIYFSGTRNKNHSFGILARLPHVPWTVSMPVFLELLESNKSTCTQSPEMCFAGRMHFQVHSDAKGVVNEVLLGRVAPYGHPCKSKAVYSLEPGENRARMKGDALWVRTDADAELHPGDFNVNISCSISGTTFFRQFNISVLPRTPWTTMPTSTVRLLSSSNVKKGDKFVVSWGFFKEGSTALSLIQPSYTSVYSLRVDNKTIPSFIVNKTLFVVSLEWTNSTTISLPMVVEGNLQVKEPGFPQEEVRLRTTLRYSNSITSLPNMTYAEGIELAAGLGTFARIAYPVQMKELAGANVTSRSVLPSDVLSPFLVTEKAGIVYLADHWQDLKSYYLNLKGILVEWSLQGKVVEVSWVPVTWNRVNKSCEHGDFIPGHHDKSEFVCSMFPSKKNCQETCGFATSLNRGGFCSWISPTKPLSPSKKVRKINYATCSTDKTFCPDFLCDPLELLDTSICPQDCTYYVLFGTLDDDGQGIGSALARLCTCDLLGKCHCDRTSNSQKGNTTQAGKMTGREPRRDDNYSASVDSSQETCDGSCLLVLVTVGTGVTLCLILSSTYFCKKSRSSCGNRNKSAMSFNSNYGAEALILPELSTIEPHHQIEVDERWDIPRCCLTVDQCLGEGEFGKVLKGTALNLKHYPGYTTVAVKTLKDNAGATELADLLSEYQLLKKVDHKNVIKLLGACTSPGGPVYIIIEYCALGSLRAYLRMHRNLRTNADMGARLPENSTMITARDVLSFAYQICKGMAYLADIKLVHRDLAARNILLAEGKVCKISDFGLTRDVYEDDTYLKQSRGRVPVKWMAIESLADQIYTTQSDVWSFGIVLWELVTLGASPYPGVTIQNLYHLLKNGYRMQKPVNCSTELYNVMRECWYEKSDDRPTFIDLVDKFGRMLEQGLDYVNFSIQMISNPSYFNPQDINDDENPQMNITFKMELGALKENNNRYENYSVGPDTSYDTPRTAEEIQLVHPT